MIRFFAPARVHLTLFVAAGLTIFALAAFLDGGASDFSARTLPNVIRILTLFDLVCTPAVAASSSIRR